MDRSGKKYHNDPFEWEEKFAQCKKNLDDKVTNASIIQGPIEVYDENDNYKKIGELQIK